MHFALLALLTLGALAPALATPSGTPSAHTCPATDNAGFAVGSTDLASDPIFCSYPAFPGESPNDFYCTYSRTTGALVQDNDAGFCAGSAPAAPVAPERRKVPHAPLPTRPQNSVRGVKDGSTRRNYLKKRRVATEHAL